MKMVVVGGSSRDIGKTSVVVGLIRALPHYHWTAIKLTQYGEQIIPSTGEEQNDTPPEQPFVIQEEADRGGKTDTSRFLKAGARRALWECGQGCSQRLSLPFARTLLATST